MLRRLPGTRSAPGCQGPRCNSQRSACWWLRPERPDRCRSHGRRSVGRVNAPNLVLPDLICRNPAENVSAALHVVGESLVSPPLSNSFSVRGKPAPVRGTGVSLPTSPPKPFRLYTLPTWCTPGTARVSGNPRLLSARFFPVDHHHPQEKSLACGDGADGCTK